MAAEPQGASPAPRWPAEVFAVLKDFDVRQVPYVPDGGLIELIHAVQGDPQMRDIALTTEEEGVAVAAGAWLGGQRAALLMQSSGVGTCVTMLSLIRTCRFPFLTLVTMRGEWGEFNPWQVPMGQATPACFEMMGVQLLRVEHAEEAAATVRAGAMTAYEGGSAVAVLLSQRLIGSKRFVK
jgi:sulfopyruvate decarboxylase alpha subunit